MKKNALVAVVGSAILAGLNSAAADNAIGDFQAPAVEAVAAKLESAVTPVVVHAVNGEPWYASRVTWGAIVAAGAPLLAALGVSLDWLDSDTAALTLSAAGSAIGGALTLYGRWRAKRAIGAK